MHWICIHIVFGHRVAVLRGNPDVLILVVVHRVVADCEDARNSENEVAASHSPICTRYSFDGVVLLISVRKGARL